MAILGQQPLFGLFEKYGLGISDGKDFGASQYIRLNFGTNKRNLMEALKRFVLCMEELNGK